MVLDPKIGLHIGQAPGYVWSVLAVCIALGTVAGIFWLVRQPPITITPPPPAPPQQPQSRPPVNDSRGGTTTEIIQPAFPTAECAGAYSSAWTGDSWVCRFSDGRVFVRKGATVTKKERWD
jgi:hypothetical protein